MSRTTGLVGLLLGFVVAIGVEPRPAAASYNPPEYTGTGAYRRVYSLSNYSYMSSYVYLPGSSQISLAAGDTAYVYTGGWGANGQGAVDAGFQYSAAQNNWTLFLSAAGSGQVDASGNRLDANQAVYLRFKVFQSGSNTDLEVIADGVDTTGTKVEESVTVQNVAGWSYGGANTLKRMTSIAQAGDNFSDGSFITGVHWYSAMIGLSSTSDHAWAAADTGGYQSYPSTPGVVTVNYVNAGEETDSIKLDAGSPNLVEHAIVPEPSSLFLASSSLLILLGARGRIVARIHRVAPAR